MFQQHPCARALRQPTIHAAHRPVAALFALGAALTLGCAQEPQASAPAVIAGDWSSARALLETYRDTHEPIYDAPIASRAVAGALIDLWVPSEAVGPYLNLAEDDFPMGAAIVREVLDEAGELQSLTLLQRMEPGFSPCGDLLFAKATPDLEPALTSDGVPLFGAANPDCTSCHLGQASSQYLFGPDAM